MSGPSQATTLLDYVDTSHAELFHTREGDGYATVQVRNHFETHPLRSKGFRGWLARLFYNNERRAPNAQAVQDALGVLEARAQHDGPEYPVYIRIAESKGRIYLDLADPEWRAVEATSDGWQIVDKPPVRFRRRAGMFALPAPQNGGSIEALRDFLNVENDDWPLMIACLTAYLRATGPYPVLNLVGEQGAAKSTAARVLRRLVDPNKADARAEPREVRDLVIAANNGWIINLDNVSHLPPWLSDALCRMSTGGGFATRELYQDAEEIIFDAQRPVILNGIADVATRSDLLDRSVIVALPQIPDEQRRAEADFWADFDEARPKILGALLDAVSVGLKNLPTVRLERLPRMADFAKWVVACEPALSWAPGTFLAAYQGNRATANQAVLDASLIVPFIRERAEGAGWNGTATELLIWLNARASEATRRLQGWPGSPRALTDTLRRLAPNLRLDGTATVLGQDRQARTGRRLIRIERVAKSPSPSSPRSPSNTEMVPKGDAGVTEAVTQVASPNGHHRTRGDAGDAGDAGIPTQSNEDGDLWDRAFFESLTSVGLRADEEQE